VTGAEPPRERTETALQKGLNTGSTGGELQWAAQTGPNKGNWGLLARIWRKKQNPEGYTHLIQVKKKGNKLACLTRCVAEAKKLPQETSQYLQ